MTQIDTEQNDDSPNKARNLRANLPNLKAHLIFWPIIATGIILDLWTKSAVFEWLFKNEIYRGSYAVIKGFLNIVIAENAGAAFGIAHGQRYLLVAVSFIALLIVLGIFLFSGTRQTMTHIALALFTAGIVGNLYDRFFNDGLVRDFIDVIYWPNRHWPAFNIADSMLCIAVGLMLIASFREHKQHQN